jgi:hypothetical protein
VFFLDPLELRGLGMVGRRRSLGRAALVSCTLQPWILLPLHDLPNMNMEYLDRFLQGLKDMNAEFIQEFPPTCAPIRCGRLIDDVDAMLTVSNDHNKLSLF